MKYIFLLEQDSEGCGYYIGCGLNWEVLEADNMDEALQKFEEEHGEYYSGDRSLKYLEVVEVFQARHIDYPKFNLKDDRELEKEEARKEYAKAKAKMVELGIW